MGITYNLTRWMKHSALALAATLAISQSAAAATPIVMATKSFTEQHILSAMTVLWLQRKVSRWFPRPISPRPSAAMR